MALTPKQQREFAKLKKKGASKSKLMIYQKKAYDENDRNKARGA